MELRDILLSAQKTSATHHKYVKELEDMLHKDGEESFYKDFKKYLLKAFKTDLKLINQYLDRFYDLCISFIHAVEAKYENIEDSKFITNIFDLILESLEVQRVEIRYNACYFIHKYILFLIKKDKTIHETLYEKIIDVLPDILDDLNPQIRVISAKIMKLLQSNQDTFSKELIKALSDSNGKVRQAVIDALLPIAENIIHIVARCRDVDEQVRITTFIKVADIPVQSFTIEQRQFLLKNGLKDASEKVKKTLYTVVLPAWLQYYECNYIKFLKALQLDSTKKEIDDTRLVSELVLKSLFQTRPIQEVLEVLILDEKLIPLENLSWESALYWKNLILFLQNKNLEQYWEQILPETVLFCNYIDRFSSTTNLLNGSIWEQQLYLLIFHELLLIALNCDVTDEASRRKIHSFLITTLKTKKISEEIIYDILKYFQVLIPNVERRVTFFLEIIADIRSPLIPKMSVDEMNENEEKKRDLNKKLKQLYAEKAQSIAEQEFQRTKEINLEITATREVLQNLEEAEEKKIEEEEHQEKSNDPEVITKCLNITQALLKTSSIFSITPELKSLKDEFFIELMSCEDPVIQGKYFRCYGMICFLDKTLAEENIQLFCLPLTLYVNKKSGDAEVILAAIDVIGDLILLHGTKILPIYEEDPEGSLDFEILFGNSPITLNEIIDVLSLLLDDENEQIRQNVCEVLVKLLLHRRIESPELFSRLFIKWLNPASAEDVRLRQWLGIFIENFCQLPDIELQLEESIIPILKTIGSSPLTSPLANISKDEVLKTIVKVINLRHDADYTIHENIAMRICVEIQKDYDSKCVPLYVKSLLYLELYRDDKEYISNLLNISEDILEELKERTAITSMKRFIYSLKHE